MPELAFLAAWGDEGLGVWPLLSFRGGGGGGGYDSKEKSEADKIPSSNKVEIQPKPSRMNP